MPKVVAILEVMWDWRQQTSEAGYQRAPRYFRINPNNFTGRRLYKLVGPGARLLVTESCKELVSSPKERGTPDPAWLNENLQILDGCDQTISPGGHQPFDLLLVCGKVAQKTYTQCAYKPRKAKVIEIPHPAARGCWNKAFIEQTMQQVQHALHEVASA